MQHMAATRMLVGRLIAAAAIRTALITQAEDAMQSAARLQRR